MPGSLLACLEAEREERAARTRPRDERDADDAGAAGTQQSTRDNADVAVVGGVQIENGTKKVRGSDDAVSALTPIPE